MRSRPTDMLSTIEKEVTAEIRAMRSSTEDDMEAALLDNPARIARHFILASHGNVQLRLRVVAKELAVEMRTLERAFSDEYQMTMAGFQVAVRLASAQWLLSIFPPTKISAVSAMLGYSLVQDFNRFFKQHTRQSPSEWSRIERAKIAQAATGREHS